MNYTLSKRSPVLKGHLFLVFLKKIPIHMKFSLKRQEKGGLLIQVTSQIRYNSYEIIFKRTRKRWPFNTGDLLDKV
jgi:hypothetical protein